ncbi:hypothetical protein E1258_31300, partial [Micromonospora sp. KC207]|uniref:hypothetical protein n=1 Tax=Micromonospora sp. KC207 TaxID=2530377 RepID=UPI001053D226
MTVTPKTDELLEQVRSGLLTPAEAAAEIRRLRAAAPAPEPVVVGLAERWVAESVSLGDVSGWSVLVVGGDEAVVSVLSGVVGLVVVASPGEVGEVFEGLVVGGVVLDAVVWV